MPRLRLWANAARGAQGVGMTEMKRPVTIQDVAREAGVSTATVSRVMSNPGIVAASTRAAVETAIRRTGYAVHHSARNLRRQRTGSIVALVPNLANPFFSQILSGVSATLSPLGYHLLIADTQNGPQAGAQLLHYLGHGVADGLILFDGGVERAQLDGAGDRPLPPMVIACEWINGLALPNVRVDNAAGAQLAVAHLAALGHRRIGHITGPAGNVLTAARSAGTRAALAQAGLDCREAWFFAGDFSLDSGAFAARAWLEMADRPTALFCASDEMAAGFIGLVQAAGLAVPRDVSVVGFDNIEIAAHLTPPLSTVRQQRTTIGVEAARMVLGCIDGSVTGAPELVLPVELIARRSSAAPAA